ncbi:uncharacterized protein LOC131946553 [Physella acuta]|uniref:uncharacterized protein LOC131946553 n=1 Tax=Physella acuta TaxID=109671 RepID=UPI0027DE7D3C|nr:uncharacterized protein LOC131946553 [Physella acuta]
MGFFWRLWNCLVNNSSPEENGKCCAQDKLKETEEPSWQMEMLCLVVAIQAIVNVYLLIKRRRQPGNGSQNATQPKTSLAEIAADGGSIGSLDQFLMENNDLSISQDKPQASSTPAANEQLGSPSLRKAKKIYEAKIQSYVTEIAKKTADYSIPQVLLAWDIMHIAKEAPADSSDLNLLLSIVAMPKISLLLSKALLPDKMKKSRS